MVAELQDEIGASGVHADPDIATVSIVGAGMRTHPGVSATMFEVLAEEGINIEMISTSAIRLTCVVRADMADRAVVALHKAFGLEGEAQPLMALTVGVYGATGQVGGVMRQVLARAQVPGGPPAAFRLGAIGRPGPRW